MKSSGFIGEEAGKQLWCPLFMPDTSISPPFSSKNSTATQTTPRIKLVNQSAISIFALRLHTQNSLEEEIKGEEHRYFERKYTET
jgi:hypothetical protein